NSVFLIVVDIQEKLLQPIWEKERLLRNSQLLVRLAGILTIPAIVSTQYAKGLRETVPETASLLPDTTPMDKTMFSCFGSDVFCSMLKRLARTTDDHAALRHGNAYLRNADCGSPRRLHGACSIRRREFADGMELAGRAGADAERECRDFIGGDV